MLVNTPPAYPLLRPSVGFKPRCWRPPDQREARWPICYAVNGKTELSVIKHSPSYRIVPTLSIVPPTCQDWVENHCLFNVELSWRARCTPHNVPGTFQQHMAVHLVLMPRQALRNACHQMGQYERCLFFPLMKSVQGKGPRHPDIELIWQMHKPPNSTLQRHLQDAVSRIG